MTREQIGTLIKFSSSPILMVIAGMFILAHMTHKAREEERALCNSANLQAELTELQRQRNATAEVLAEAKAKAEQQEGENAKLEDQVRAYESVLAAQPDADSCKLSADDVKRLRGLQ